MASLDFIATQGMDDPRMIRICTECKHHRCETGICDEYVAAYFSIYGREKNHHRKAKKYECFGVRLDLNTWARFAGCSANWLRKKMSNVGLYRALGCPPAQTVYDWARQWEAERWTMCGHGD